MYINYLTFYSVEMNINNFQCFHELYNIYIVVLSKTCSIPIHRVKYTHAVHTVANAIMAFVNT